MAKQDDFVRITLRLPKDLHQKLTSSAGAGSLNAEIVARLEVTYSDRFNAVSSGEVERELQRLRSETDEVRSYVREQVAGMSGLIEFVVERGGTLTENELDLFRKVLESRGKGLP